MNYTFALSMAAKATAYLQENEGSMSKAEAAYRDAILAIWEGTTP